MHGKRLLEECGNEEGANHAVDVCWKKLRDGQKDVSVAFRVHFRIGQSSGNLNSWPKEKKKSHSGRPTWQLSFLLLSHIHPSSLANSTSDADQV